MAALYISTRRRLRDVDEPGVAIENNEKAHRFEARFPDGVAYLKYHYDHEGRLSLDHTEVPPSEQHHGVAAGLAKAAFDSARERGLVVVPVCPYVLAYLKVHPELDSLVGAGAARN